MILPPFPEHGNTNWAFYGPHPASNAPWQTWLKPVGAQWVFILAVGPGGGGGGGGSTAASARTGGGGGGGGCLSRIIVPAFVLPDLLYIMPAFGGAGGTAAGNGTAGGTTRVGLAPDTSNAAFRIMESLGGGAGLTAATAGGGGTTNLYNFSAFGLPVAATGQAGAVGGANTGAAGTALAIGSLPTTGGAGGASSSSANSVNAGGNLTGANPATGTAFWPTINGGAAGVSGTTPGGNGFPGVNHGKDIEHTLSRNMPLIFSGGSGGGSGGASNGGSGGPGAWGCGGGGGGAGATGGAGGKGGDGFVIIGAF